MSWDTFFPRLLNMSLTASVVILFVIFARLLLKRTPKIFSYALWYVVLFRLFCPVAISSPLSLLGMFDAPAIESHSAASSIEYIPGNIVHIESPEVHKPAPSVNDMADRQLPQEAGQPGTDPWEFPAALATWIWGTGLLAMAGYGVISYLGVRKKLKVVIPLRDNIFIADDIQSPFVIGFFRPRIYLPCGLGDKEQEYIILHEQHHIRRLDHIVKALVFIALCVHWFNPLVWLAFVLASKDMEMSCDEAVIRRMGENVRADYSASLLALATGRRMIAGTPLAFGEGDTKGRIRNLANWRKPAFWVILAAVTGCATLAVCLLTNPMGGDEQEDGDRLTIKTSEAGDGGEPEANSGSSNEKLEVISGRGAGDVSEPISGEGGEDESGTAASVTQLTLDDVAALAEKGDVLSWADFEQYLHEDVGSGLYIWHFEIDEIFSLSVGGGSLESNPMYIYLQAYDRAALHQSKPWHVNQQEQDDDKTKDIIDKIDIRDEDVWTFAERIWYETSAIVVAHSDLDHDGETENVVVRTVIPDQVYELAVEKEDGTQIWTTEASPAHVGWNTIMLYSEGGQDYLIQYLPTMFQGVGNYTCTMFSLEGGKETMKEKWFVNFELRFLLHSAEETLEMTPEMIWFSEEVGSLLGKSIVLLSTEQGVLVEGPKTASALPQLYPVCFDPEEIQAAMDNGMAEVKKLSPDAAGRPDTPLEMLFFSGAGGWGTTLTLQPDGTFTGEHGAQDMGYTPLEYPHGVLYICRFSGRFSEPTQISDYAFSMYLEELTTEEPAGKEWIEDSVRYVTSDPIGMTDGEEFILYAPGTPADELSGEFRDTWWPDAWLWRSGEVSQLNYWGLCNVNTGEGFFEYSE